jgi:glycosyltransferase involved in cell wall biosynthesis
VKIEWISRDLAMRFGGREANVSEDEALRFIKKGMAKPAEAPPKPVRMPERRQVTGPARRRQYDTRKLPGEEYEPYLTPVAWVQDFGRTGIGIGGAEFSNDRVVEVGRSLGFDVRVITEKQHDKYDRRLGWNTASFSEQAKHMLADASFVVLNNTSSFSRTQWMELLFTLFDRGVPFVRYEHDYGFCRRRTSLNCEGERNTCETSEGADQEKTGLGKCWQKTIDLYRHIFCGARLSVFIGRDQERIHRAALGDEIDPFMFLTPPLDVEHFRPVPNVIRRKNSVVSMTGKIHHWVKGLHNLAAHIREHPKFQYTVYGEVNDEAARILMEFSPRVKYLKPIPYEQLPLEYSRHEYVIHLPEGWEPSGRTPWEGFLCGCKMIVNERVGSCQLGIPDDREKAREVIQTGPYRFWRAAENAVA